MSYGFPIHVTDLLAREDLTFISLHFTDLSGRWMRFTWPKCEFGISRLRDGVVVSAHCIGWRGVRNSEYLFRPDLQSCFINAESHTISFICDLFEPDGSAPFMLDPRGILRRAIAMLQKRLPGAQLMIGPELEFYIFDEVRFDAFSNNIFVSISEPEGTHNMRQSSASVNRGATLSHPVYHLAETTDYSSTLRRNIVGDLLKAGLRPTHCFHESGPSQAEIGLHYDEALLIADAVQRQKAIVRSAVSACGKIATFMPKPHAYNPGSGLHLHFSLWQGDTNLFYSECDDIRLSETAYFAIGGIIDNIGPLAALCNSTANSYCRTAHIFSRFQDTFFGVADRSASVRSPTYTSPEAVRAEVRFPDSSSNIYLTIAGLICAMIDGIERRIFPNRPLTAEEQSAVNERRLRAQRCFPLHLDDAILALQTHRDFLKVDGVFTDDFFVSYENELIRRARLARQPHPSHFVEALDC